MKKVSSKKKRVSPFFLAALILLLCDMVSKYWTFYHFPNLYYPTPFYPYGGIGIFQNFVGIDFCLNRVTNNGGAWGVFHSYPTVLLIVRMAILLGVMVYAIFINDVKKRRIPFLLLLTGAMGNIIDCFLYGSVVDMLHFTLWGYSFPVFNFADTLIFLGVVSLVLQSLFKKKKKHVPSLSR